MPHISDDAVCIRRWDWSETSQTVSLLTRHHGIIRGIAKGAKREKGRFSGGIDLLARGQVVAIVKQTSSVTGGGASAGVAAFSSTDQPLATITEWSVMELYPAIRTSLPANRAGLYLADVVMRMLIDHDPHPVVFEALTLALSRLGNNEMIDAAVLEFQWSLLRETGYQPEVNRDVETGAALDSIDDSLRFIPLRGGFTTETAAKAPSSEELTSWRVRPETLGVLRSLGAGNSLTAAGGDVRAVPAGAIGRANRLLAAYMRELIGSEPPTLAWMFPDLARTQRSRP